MGRVMVIMSDVVGMVVIHTPIRMVLAQAIVEGTLEAPVTMMEMLSTLCLTRRLGPSLVVEHTQEVTATMSIVWVVMEYITI